MTKPLESELYDVAVIGGGIHGVGVAQAAAAAGHSVALFEQKELAYGTSSKSSKLIHGGLRYLESYEFSLVRESLRERELLIKNAPELVRRQDFYIPVYDTTQRPAWMMRAGLILYSVLAGLGKTVRFESVARNHWENLDGISTKGLKKVFRYTDGQTDDRILTRAVMQSAQSFGAELACPAEVTRIEIKDAGCDIEYTHQESNHSVRAHTIVNAAGPWANRILKTVTPSQPLMPVDLVQGTHLELPGKIEQGCYYIEMPKDKRAVFVIPWKGRTMLGTTEHAYEGDPGQVSVLPEEVDYLLEGYQQHFPDRDTEVIKSWAGLRVLPSAKGAAFKRSRETQLPVDNKQRPRFLSIFGGKLTGYRATAVKVLKTLKPMLPSATAVADTAEVKLTPVEGDSLDVDSTD